MKICLKGFRKAISVHYADNNCKFINVVGTSQENIANEIEHIVKKHGVAINYVVMYYCLY